MVDLINLYGQNDKDNTIVSDNLVQCAGLPYDSTPFEHDLNWTAMTWMLAQ